MVTDFPPLPDEMVYVEDDCLKDVHASGPVDIGCDFEAVDELVLSNLTRSSFQYTEYFDLIHDFSKFFSKWLTVDTVQFYQCWVWRSTGSYRENIFLLPLDYYKADMEDIFEDYWNGIQPVVKNNFGMRMWRYGMSTLPVTYDTKSTLGRRKVVPVTLQPTFRRLLRGISIFSSARLFVSMPEMYSTTACLPASTPAILSMVTGLISRSVVLPRLTAMEADNCHFQGLRHSLNTSTFY
jgi:hypothetical protein